MNLPLHPDTLLDELQSIRKIVDKWVQRVDKEPIPGVDGGDPAAQEVYLRELIGELFLAGRKCHGLVDVLNER